LPSVSVPVLSNATTVIVAARSRWTPPLNNTPRRAAPPCEFGRSRSCRASHAFDVFRLAFKFERTCFARAATETQYALVEASLGLRREPFGDLTTASSLIKRGS
jgi:hypothetical protein